jgi:hypothetical protein
MAITRERLFERDFSAGAVNVREGDKDENDKRPIVATFSLADLPEDVRAKLTVVGLATMLSAGAPVPSERFDLLRSGGWPHRGGGREAGPDFDALALQAMLAKKGVERSVEQVRATLDAMDDAKRRAVRADAKFKAVRAKLEAQYRAEQAKSSNGSAEDLLSDF